MSVSAVVRLSQCCAFFLDETYFRLGRTFRGREPFFTSRDVDKWEGEPFITCFTHEIMRYVLGKIQLLKLQEKGSAGERRSLTKNDIHLTWKLSDNIVIVLCFVCQPLFPLLCFTEVDKIL